MWQEVAVYVIVAGAAFNLVRVFRSTMGSKSGCGKCPSSGCAKNSESASSDSVSPKPLVQLQNNLRS